MSIPVSQFIYLLIPLFILCGSQQTVKNSGIPDHLTYLLRNMCAGQTLRNEHEKQTRSKLEKEYIKVV